MATVPPVVTVPSVASAQSAPLGRAARRRQLARWKKNQRRAVVATAVALVGGGLSAVALDRQGGDRAQAASAPENPTVSGREEPTSEYTRTTTTGSDAHRSSSADATAPSRSGDRARGQDVPTGIRPDTAASPRTGTTAPTATAPRQTTTSSYDGTVTTPGGTAGTTGTTDGPSSTSTSTSPSNSPTTDESDTSASTSNSSTGSSSTGSSSSQSGTSSASTSPSEVCLLGLVCLS
ncbi:hypothetical protein AQJ58_38160 [Streptomyces sp. DSM 15324]|nr:hypothetical protein AQJ58_38160 [Streptomyces sp. DSM 15324]